MLAHPSAESRKDGSSKNPVLLRRGCRTLGAALLALVVFALLALLAFLALLVFLAGVGSLVFIGRRAAAARLGKRQASSQQQCKYQCRNLLHSLLSFSGKTQQKTVHSAQGGNKTRAAELEPL